MKYNAPKSEDLYFMGYTRLFMAIVVSLILINHSTDAHFTSLIRTKSFYFALVLNLPLAALIIELSHWLNLLLDKYCAWKLHFKKRCVVQFVFGVAAIVYIDVLLVEAMYHILDQDFKQSGFIENVLPVNIFLIGLLKLLFYFRRHHPHWFAFKRWVPWRFGRQVGLEAVDSQIVVYSLPTENLGPRLYQKVPIQSTSFKLTEMDRADGLLVYNMPPDGMWARRLKKVRLQLPLMRSSQIALPNYWKVVKGFIQSTKYVFILEEVLCIKTGAVYGDIFLKSGKAYNMHYRRKVLTENLDPNRFVETRSGTFYAIDAIKGVMRDGDSRKLILKPEYADIEVDRNISRRYFSQVSSFFENKY